MSSLSIKRHYQTTAAPLPSQLRKNVVCFPTVVNGSEAAAPVRNGASSLQSHSSSCCCHTNPATGKPKQGEPTFHKCHVQVVKNEMKDCTGIYSMCNVTYSDLSLLYLTCSSEVIYCIYSHLRSCVCALQEKVQLQYKLTFIMGEQEHSESGSLEQLPPPDSWGNL